MFEAQGGWNYATETNPGRTSEKWSDDVHLVGVVADEAAKNFFSVNTEGFHPSLFRGNTFIDGTYKGRFLSEYPQEEIKALLRRWGIRYLVLWIEEARHYFAAQPGSYTRIWRIDSSKTQGFEPVQGEIYEFLQADPRSVVVFNGSGDLETRDYFSKLVRLRRVVRGEKVVVRTNYSPAWRAYQGNNEIGLFSVDGQLAFVCPKDGNTIISLYFPKYRFLIIIALVSLALCFFLSRKRRVGT
ncbi:MAG: hypothetical protein NTZ78_12585 [Candidatus Aureabacteria bacterium]|nr:hypothetical protein [Candidatus Auribacterota bacterium]